MIKKKNRLYTTIFLMIWIILLILIPFGVSIVENNNFKNNVSYISSEFNIEDYEAYTILELPYIYYLGYTVTTEQNENVQTFESDNGMLTIKLDENIESAHITVKYKGTIIEKVSYVISIISIITFISYLFYYKRMSKQENIK